MFVASPPIPNPIATSLIRPALNSLKWSAKKSPFTLSDQAQRSDSQTHTIMDTPRHSKQNASHPAASAPVSLSRSIHSSSTLRLPILPSTRQSRVPVPSSFAPSALGIGMMKSSSSAAHTLKSLISHPRTSSARTTYRTGEVIHTHIHLLLSPVQRSPSSQVLRFTSDSTTNDKRERQGQPARSNLPDLLHTSPSPFQVSIPFITARAPHQPPPSCIRLQVEDASPLPRAP
ncbi:hypothetical protein BDN70DRAFT_343864 [Pholiota conissans]|uniref:Uncharacterized protein n=1 Tax=Pholiota conissans TaxID=109636 RepID=A0A9P5YUJ7_9AGAR|nr:hypothetical protein BDN70DRAFT_343864 [Pholiota conissans]